MHLSTDKKERESLSDYIKNPSWTKYLDLAQMYADSVSGCNKVSVGSVIVRDGRMLSMGANRAIPDLCKSPRGCLRVEKYGEDSKTHRCPEDCRAIHSELDAICSAACDGVSVQGASIFVTRYPCESCAKAIIRAGIKQVIYGGTSEISEYTAAMLERYGVDYIHVLGWKEDLSDR